MNKFFSDIPGAPKAVGPYSPIAQSGGFYFFSGQVGLNPESGKLAGDAIETQTAQVLKNIDLLLGHIKKQRSDIVKTTIFLTDLSYFQTVNAMYGEWLGGHRPARSTIQVAALPLGAIVEIECVVG